MAEVDVAPSQTIYINNLNEKVKKDDLKKALYNLFSQFGVILDVVAMKTLKARGQAFIVFKDVTSAANALRQMQGFTFNDKPMKINYAKTKSDAVAKQEGTFVPRDRKRKAEPMAGVTAPQREREKKAPKPALAPEQTVDGHEPPNKILFVQNLPDSTTDAMLGMLFQQFEGYAEVRMVPGKPGIAFVEFHNEQQSATAMMGLQGFKISADKNMKINFAKK